MGIYDRDYSRGPEPGLHLSAPQTATMQLVLVTFAVYVVQIIAPKTTDYLALQSDWYRHPWEAYQLLTYGFVHSLGRRPGEPGVLHIIGNMFMLWMFGRDVEQRYGRSKFLAYYLTAIVVSGLVWSISSTLSGEPGNAIGASGGAVAVVVLFALLFPHRTLLLYFAIPVPAWAVGLFIVVSDLFGAMRQNGHVAFAAHLGGAAFAVLFYKYGWVPGFGLMTKLGSWRPRPRHQLRVVRDEDDDVVEEQDDLAAQVDVILQKIKEKGQDSLSWSERRLLERASREYRQKRQ